MLKRNPQFESANFLTPKFEISLPFYDAESQYLRWCLAILILLSLFLFSRLYKNNKLSLKIIFGSLLTLSAIAYTDFASFHEVGNGATFSYIHWDDLFHYSIGSKYYPEHRRKYFYESGLLALKELYKDEKFLQDKFYRRMSDYRLIRASEIERNEKAIKSRFSPARWKEFKEDIAFFQTNYPPQARLVKAFTDHGYNPSPMYTVVARIFSNHSPYSFESVHALALIDPILLLISLALLVYSFGFWGVVFSCFIFFLHYPSHFDLVGGSFMRFPWFAALSAGLALANKEKYLLSGIFLGIATCFRGFPAICLISLVAPLLWSVAQQYQKEKFNLFRSLNKNQTFVKITKIWIGSGISAFILIGLASAHFGFNEITTWYKNSKFHSTRIPPNTLSSVSLLSFTPKLTSSSIKNYYQNRIYDKNKYGDSQADLPDLDSFYNSIKKQTLGGRLYYYLSLLTLAWLLFVFASKNKSPTEALVIGLPLLFFGANTIANYYYCFVALFPLYYFCDGKNNFASSIKITQILLLMIVLQHWVAQIFDDYDVIFAWQSGFMLLFFWGFYLSEIWALRKNNSQCAFGSS